MIDEPTDIREFQARRGEPPRRAGEVKRPAIRMIEVDSTLERPTALRGA